MKKTIIVFFLLILIFSCDNNDEITNLTLDTNIATTEIVYSQEIDTIANNNSVYTNIAYTMESFEHLSDNDLFNETMAGHTPSHKFNVDIEIVNNLDVDISSIKGCLEFYDIFDDFIAEFEYDVINTNIKAEETTNINYNHEDHKDDLNGSGCTLCDYFYLQIWNNAQTVGYKYKEYRQGDFKINYKIEKVVDTDNNIIDIE